MNYGKLIDGRIVRVRSYIDYNGQRIVNPSEEQVKDAGYKKIVTESPEEREGFYAVPQYVETAKQIRVTYTYEPIPNEEAE